MHDSTRPDGPPLHAERSTPDDPCVGRALALVRLLRERCPWDARQSPRSLRPYLLEEAHEVAQAIEDGDDDALRGELGDLLLNLAFQIVLAEERRAFSAREVVEALEAKMEARHPHIYGEAEEPPDWEAMKARERAARASDPFEGIPPALEPLGRALRILDRAGALGFDWPDPRGPLAQLEEEAGELRELLDRDVERGSGSSSAAGPRPPPPEARRRVEEEVGDLLLAAVSVARAVRVHPANALLSAGDRFETRFRAARRLAEERSIRWEDASPGELKALWDEAGELGSALADRHRD